MAADAKKIILIVLYSIIALGIIVALALLLKIPAQKPQPASVAIQTPIPEPSKTVQDTLAATNQTNPTPDESGTVISIVFNNQEEPANSASETSVSEPTATSIPVPTPPAQTKPTGAAGSSTTTSVKPTNQVVKPSASQTTQSQKQQTRYWIQVASFSTKLKAEDMQRMLAEKSLTSYLISSVVSGKTWYRVRIGPYNSKADAERWLSTIKNIPDCSDAFIIIQQ
ncbi:MAG TPA: SPOR domain-containing protein [Spirochaetia bacterium]|nr:SPOR domain-containing protein [Spirochaetales bacterium]HOT58674.1 SPOR domain-containing protein [Spirochaetales bacterium]HPD80546.1 SPOR domain-containing protein [Spirochaetales bacterium]HRS66148.1 SPOR domain-containing protein [Spirochaetia bacterium]HRV27627.1 SPOR domain-containing protein [Spirochaetia bacterium]